MNNFSTSIYLMLTESGISNSCLISEDTNEKSFGNSMVIFKFGAILMKFVSDKGQVLFDVGSEFNPDIFLPFEDIAIFMKWKSMNDIMGLDKPLELKYMLQQLGSNMDEMQSLFSSQRQADFQEKILKIGKERGDLTMKQFNW